MGDHKHKSKKSSRDHKERSSSSSSKREHKKHKSSHKKAEKELDYSDPSLWVEVGATEITPAEHLRNHQRAAEAVSSTNKNSTDDSMYPQEQEARHGWMLDGGLDFGSMGSARVKEEEKPKPNPDFVSECINQILYERLTFRILLFYSL